MASLYKFEGKASPALAAVLKGFYDTFSDSAGRAAMTAMDTNNNALMLAVVQGAHGPMSIALYRDIIYWLTEREQSARSGGPASRCEAAGDMLTLVLTASEYGLRLRGVLDMRWYLCELPYPNIEVVRAWLCDNGTDTCTRLDILTLLFVAARKAERDPTLRDIADTFLQHINKQHSTPKFALSLDMWPLSFRDQVATIYEQFGIVPTRPRKFILPPNHTSPARKWPTVAV